MQVCALEDPETTNLVLHEYKTATNMTEQFAALAAIVPEQLQNRKMKRKREEEGMDIVWQTPANSPQPQDYIFRNVKCGRIQVDGKMVPVSYIVKPSQKISHFLHKHESPVMALDIAVLQKKKKGSNRL